MDVEKLMENEEFLAKLKETQNAAEAAALFTRYGVTITEAELEAYIAAQEEGELSEEALETVAGGCLLLWPIRFPRWFPPWRPPNGRAFGGGGGGSR